MKIDRTRLLDALERFAFAGNGVVVGAPGVGKSYSLVSLRRRLRSKSIPHLFLAIDQLGSGTEEELRSELAYQGDLIGKLRMELERSGGGRGLLIIDAFDAARSDVKQRNFLRIIRQAVKELRGSWNVIVSVRTYDAERSQELLDLFSERSGDVPASLYRENRIPCRHFKIPLLDETEVIRAVAQIREGRVAYEQGSEDFRELLRIPFNLWLLEKLLSEWENSASTTEIGEARSQVQLLQLFWNRRVRGARDGDQREVALTRITRAMVAERTLSMRKENAFALASEETWRSLFSDGVLEEASSTGQHVGYSHNLLFDFAVSVLLIEDDPDAVISFLTEDPSRPLFLRPSLTFYFTRLWYDTPAIFWSTFWRILPSSNPRLRLFARLLPSAVVVNEARTWSQLAPLEQRLSRGDEIANDAVLRVLQAIRALQVGKDRLWADFLEQTVVSLHRTFAWELATVTFQILGKARDLGDSELLDKCGRVGRELLKWTLRERRQDGDAFVDRLGSAYAVPMVVQTFGTAPNLSRELLERVLDLTNEDGFPIDFLLRLTDDVDKVWQYDPELAASVYEAVFAHVETSRDPTHMGGIVLPLLSNRRQDFDLCRYRLVEQFPKFLEVRPIEATRAAVVSLNRFITSEHLIPYWPKDGDFEGKLQHFVFRDGEANYVADGSYIWDEGPYADEPIKIADELFKLIGSLTSSQEDLLLLDRLLDVLRDEAWMAFFWRRLLRTAGETSEVFAPQLFELCVAAPIQAHSETIWDLGNFLEAASPYFEESQRAFLEGSLIRLPELAEDRDEREFLEHHRNRLLVMIPSGLIVTEEAQRLREEIKQDLEAVATRPPVTFEMWSEPYSQERHLHRQGADLSRPENQALLDLSSSLDAFRSKWLNEIPDDDAVRAALPVAEDLYRRVQHTAQADQAVVDSAWSNLASSVAILSRTAWQDDDYVFDFCREVMLACSEHPSPEPKPEWDARFDYPTWSPEPRNEAAEGLPWLTLRRSDERILWAIDRLLEDEVPSVRYLSARNLFRLNEKHPAGFWRLVYRTAEHETNRVVSQGLCTTLWYTIAEHESETIEALDLLFKKELQDYEHPVLDDLIDLIVWLLMRRDNNWAVAAMDNLLSDPVRFRKPMKRAVLGMSRYIDLKSTAAEPVAAMVDRSLHWQSAIIDAAAYGVSTLRGGLPQHSQGSDEETRRITIEVYDVIDEVITRLYFAADLRGGPHGKQEKASLDEERERFYYKIKPLLEQVLAFAQSDGNGMLLAPTAHYFMQLLNGVLSYDPQGVLRMAAGIALSSEHHGYNLDSIAVREVVTLVSTALTDHRAELQQDRALRHLLALLDVFAGAGWPDALNLVWQLDEVFR